eukprot:976318-Pyramimonas_sp.AAC.1
MLRPRLPLFRSPPTPCLPPSVWGRGVVPSRGKFHQQRAVARETLRSSLTFSCGWNYASPCLKAEFVSKIARRLCHSAAFLKAA